MKKNKMLSLAAALVLTSTAAMAFDTISTGQIVTNSAVIVNGYVKSGYNPNFTTAKDGARILAGYVATGAPAPAVLTKSASHFGDALIYSAFKADGDWKSTITVTNTSSTNAVVAKVALYASDDSRELIDFNIYLSANDVFTFTVDENGVSTIDDSIEVSAIRAETISGNSDADNVTMNTYGDSRQITAPLPVTEGYAIVYAMAEATAGNGRKLAIGRNIQTSNSYHKDHGDLFLDFREMLDTCRNGTGDAWRAALLNNNNMTNGMIRLAGTEAPNVLDTCDNTDADIGSKIGINYRNDTNFVDPSSSILFGAVSIASTATTASSDARDMLLPAVPLSNFTSNGTLMAWTSGEAAAISDRNMVGSIVTAAGVAADARTFEVTSAYYNYSDTDLANTLHITSPIKRPLVQLLGNASYWTGVNPSKPYGEFDYSSTIYNDQEDNFTVATSTQSGVIVSPYNPDTAVVTDKILIESGGLSNLQAPAVTADPVKYKKGYVQVNFTSGKYPAIVTQMSAQTISGQSLTNWIYSPVTP